MLGHFCLTELDLASHLLYKIQFTFEVVPCLILSLFRQVFQRCVSILAQRYKGVGREEARAPQVKTRGYQFPTDGPDHICTTRPKGPVTYILLAHFSIGLPKVGFIKLLSYARMFFRSKILFLVSLHTFCSTIEFNSYFTFFYHSSYIYNNYIAS